MSQSLCRARLPLESAGATARSVCSETRSPLANGDSCSMPWPTNKVLLPIWVIRSFHRKSSSITVFPFLAEASNHILLLPTSLRCLPRAQCNLGGAVTPDRLVITSVHFHVALKYIMNTTLTHAENSAASLLISCVTSRNFPLLVSSPVLVHFIKGTR
jgi:hypothetical protein